MEDRTPFQMFKIMYKDQHTPLPLPSRSSVEGGTYIVTGANSGLGFECAKHLVNLGAARVILGVRSPDKGKAAQVAIEKATGRRGVCEVWQVDLASFDSVEAFSKRVATLDRVDAIVNNGGIEVDRWRTVEDGLEVSLVVNVLGTLLLCLKTLPILSKVAKKHGIHPRMEVVSSAIVHMANEQSVDSVTGNIFDAWSQESAMSGLRYAESKVLITYAIRQLGELAPLSETGVIINLVAPGLCTTGLGGERAFGFKMFQKVLRLVMARSAEQGSRTLLHGATAGAETHGRWLDTCRIEDDYLPVWMVNEKGHKSQARVWSDALAALSARGRRVDVDLLAPKSQF